MDKKTVWRIYLREPDGLGWQEFGIDYTTREEAIAVRDRYAEQYPHHDYIVRRVKVRA